MGYLLLLFGLFANKPNCSCIPLGPINDKQYEEYDLIAKGKIVKVSVKAWTRTIYLNVKTYYKGKKQSQIKIITPSTEGMCGIGPHVGEDWLIFAYNENKSYRTELCTRTKNLNPKAWDYNKDEIDNDIKFLEEKTIYQGFY